MITYPFLLALGHLAGACDAGDTPGGGATVEATGAGSANAADATAEAPASTTPGAASPAGAAPLPGSAAPARAGATATAEAPRTILFVGTSLTAGYGVGEDRAYPALLQEKIDAAGLPYRVVNAGVSGETSAGGLSRIDWLLENPVDVFVLELGANDGLRGLDIEAMRRNLDEILTRTRARYPDAELVVLGMEAPPNLGRAYTDAFRRVFAELAERHNAAFVPFLLEGVAAVPALNQSDGIHPNVRGHEIIAETVWPVLRDLLAASR